MTGRTKIHMLRLKQHAIKPQFILRRGAYWTDLASGQTSAKYFCWITLRMPSRMTRLLLFVHITRVMPALSRPLHRSCVPIGDKVTGISIYLRVKTSPSPSSRSPAAKKIPQARSHRRDKSLFILARTNRRASNNEPGIFPGKIRAKEEGADEEQREKSIASVYVSDSSTMSY